MKKKKSNKSRVWAEMDVFVVNKKFHSIAFSLSLPLFFFFFQCDTCFCSGSACRYAVYVERNNKPHVCKWYLMLESYYSSSSSPVAVVFYVFLLHASKTVSIGNNLDENLFYFWELLLHPEGECLLPGPQKLRLLKYSNKKRLRFLHW